MGREGFAEAGSKEQAAAVHGQEPGKLDGCHPEGWLAQGHAGCCPRWGRVCTDLQPSCSPAKPKRSKTHESDALNIPWRA